MYFITVGSRHLTGGPSMAPVVSTGLWSQSAGPGWQQDPKQRCGTALGCITFQHHRAAKNPLGAGQALRGQVWSQTHVWGREEDSGQRLQLDCRHQAWLRFALGRGNMGVAEGFPGLNTSSGEG